VVPGNAARGDRPVTASCRPGGDPTVATAAITVTGARVHRPALVTSLHLPSQVPAGVKDLGLSALVAVALVALIGFPCELFDSTLAENYGESTGWFRFLAPRARPFRGA